MTKRYASLCLLLCAALLLGRVMPLLRAAPVIAQAPWHRAKDAESRLARGERFDFCSAGIYELELIPGISDNLALRLTHSRNAILAAAKRQPLSTRYKALTIVRGIGPKRAKTISHYMTLSCRRVPARRIYQPPRSRH